MAVDNFFKNDILAKSYHGSLFFVHLTLSIKNIYNCKFTTFNLGIYIYIYLYIHINIYNI